jgi:hypothetical protein
MVPGAQWYRIGVPKTSTTTCKVLDLRIDIGPVLQPADDTARAGQFVHTVCFGGSWFFI